MGRRPRVDRSAVLAAARAVFGERGFDGATLAEIASRVGVSPSALLRHAPTKQALFDAAMTAQPGELRVPFEFLADIDAAKADPRAVLRRAAEAFVPFLEERLGEVIAIWMHAKRLEADFDSLPLPYDRELRPTPPERALALVENYLRRAARAGRLDLRDPRAAALAYLASLHSYVMLHRVARAVEPPLPLSRYLDTLVELWSHGAIRPQKEKR